MLRDIQTLGFRYRMEVKEGSMDGLLRVGVDNMRAITLPRCR